MDQNFIKEMEDAWDVVDRLWTPNADIILGEAGAQFVRSHAIATSSHEFVVATTMLACMSPLSNGATVNLFADTWTPLNCAAVLVGYAQTRKSQMTKLCQDILVELDNHIREMAETKVAADEDRTTLQMHSVLLSSFTPAALFERLSGGFKLVDNPRDFKAPGLNGVLHLGRMLNVDEVYSHFADLGLTPESRKKSGAPAASPVNEFAGSFNRAFQFGESSHVTKTAGAYGRASDAPTTWSLLGNMHPQMGVLMERGEIGNHTGCLKERLWLYGSRRVQPHADIPTDYTLPQGVQRWIWVDLDQELAEMSGLGSIFGDPAAASQSDLVQGSEGPTDGTSYPNSDGYTFTLPDGVPSRLRFRKHGEVYVTEFRVANRDFPLPANHNIQEATKRVLLHFKQMGRKFSRSDEVKKQLTSLTALYNVKASQAADLCRDSEAAMWGISPWKLGVLSALLVPLDVFLGNPVLGEPNSDEVIQLPVQNIVRAKMWVEVLNAFRGAWQVKDTGSLATRLDTIQLPPNVQASAFPGFMPNSRMMAFSEPERTRRAPGVPAEGGGRDVRRRLETVPAAGGQPLLSPIAEQAVRGGSLPALPAEEHHEDTTGENVDGDPGLLESGHHGMARAQAMAEDEGALDAFPELTQTYATQHTVEAEKPETAGIALSLGYGENGATVQDSTLFTDREVTRRTVLRGTAVVRKQDVLAVMKKKKSGERSKTSLKATNWEAVMKAGFANYPIGKLEHGGTNQSSIVLAAPPLGNPVHMRIYHNLLVDLCQVSMRTFTSELSKRQMKEDAAPGARPNEVAPAVSAGLT